MKQYAVFPTDRNYNRVPGGPNNSLSSVLLYTHVLYEGKDVRVYSFCYSSVLHYWQRCFQHHNDYSALFKYAARKATGCCTLFQIYWGNTGYVCVIEIL